MKLLCLVVCAILVFLPVSSLIKRNAFAQAPAAPLPTPGVPGLNLPNLQNVRQIMPPQVRALWSNLESNLDHYDDIPTGVPSLSSMQPRECIDCDPCFNCGDPCPSCPPPNQAPAANAGGPYEGTPGSPVEFNGTGSYDPDGTIMQYNWDFGDGATGTGATPAHTYHSAGLYSVTLTVIDSNSATDTHTTSATINSGPPPPPVTNNAAYATDVVPSTMIAGQSYSVSIGMRNTGTSTWTSAEEYRLGSQNPQDNNTWGVGRVNVPSTIPPNATATFNFTVVAPSTPGTYNFQWRMLREHVEWFGEYTPNFTITVNPPSTGGTPGPSTNVLSAQLEPGNRTGQTGEDLLSGNYNWSLPLLGLTGRAGHDLSLALSYNSLVWTKYQSSIQYNADQGFPAPGFRLGFPVIQPRFLHDATGIYSYLLITPSGAHVELRQIGTSNIYEAADSSYLQLIDYGSSLLVRDTGGKQWSFSPINGQYQCTQIKDRNGNFISVAYNGLGKIGYLVDTLGRAVNFNYDVNNLLQSITQTWNGQTHPWATFLYSSIYVQTNFSGLSVIGPNNSNQIVLTQVSLHDGSRFAFTYTSWGQVYQIEHYAADGHRLNYVSYNLPQSAAVALNDCPRFTQRRDFAENWNNGLEAVSSFAIDPNGAYGQVTMPDNITAYKEFYAVTGWQKGLATRSETWHGGALQKYSTTTWTQDNAGVTYRTNPRVIETNIYDASGNRRRTTTDYSVAAYRQYGLPYFVTEYAADGVTELRRTYNDYNLSPSYLDRRIIGLVSAVHLTDANGYQSKVTYNYDSNAIDSQATTATQHDASYNASFLTRGNVTAVSRWDVTDINNSAKALTSQTSYNAAGSVVATTDPAGHTTSITYADSFSDSNNTRNTFAYPTTLTDADGFRSFVWYHYDLGVKTQVQGPPPEGQPYGATTNFQYDGVGRLVRVTTANNGAYTRWVYPASQNFVQSFTTIRDLATEAYSVQVFDGAGRLRATATDHPGSSGGYAGQYFVYDIMGRRVQQSNPTEMTGSWVAFGDDAPGWIWSYQAYDWLGRPTVTTNQDSTQAINSYSACGCAGGEVTTMTDPSGRHKKVYSDVLGRAWKTEVLNPDGTVYGSAINAFDSRDQIVRTREYAGDGGDGSSCPSGTCQETVFTFDGYGRVASRHVPEQSAGTATTFSYKPDDSLWTVTDARGATTSYSYNGRHQVTAINYGAPWPVFVPAAVSFNYDAAGNRSSMTDGLGTVTYQHDQLSRLISESRALNDIPGQVYTMSYGYNIGGKLTTVTDPFNYQVSYAHDSTGRLNSISRVGSQEYGYQGLPDTFSNIQYRAFGKIKEGTISWNGNTTAIAYTHNSRLEVSRFQLSSSTSGTRGAEYQRYADGRVSYARDLSEPEFDRAYSFDHVGRVTQGLAGAEARGSTPADGPYKQSYGYDAFNNLNSRAGRHWNRTSPTKTFTFVNNRNPQWQYDADGRVTSGDGQQIKYDAAGRQVAASGAIVDTYDGDGRLVKIAASYSNYDLPSSVLDGQVLTRISYQGIKLNIYTYANGKRIGNEYSWEIDNPINSGSLYVSYGSAIGRANEFSPIGDNVGIEDPYWSGGGDGSGGYPAYGDPTTFRCGIDGMEVNCQSVNKFAINRHRIHLVSLMVRQRIGMVVPKKDATLVPGGSHAGTTIYGEANTNDPSKISRVEVIAEPDHFDLVSAGTLTSWLQLRPLEYLALVPQKTRIGRPSFTNRGAYVDQNVLNDCTKELFGVELRSFTESRRGVNGSFTGFGPDQLTRSSNGLGPQMHGNDTTFTVVNEVRAYTSRQLRGFYNQGQPPNQQLPANSFVTGYTGPTPSGYTPYRNFTASNLRNPMEILKTQVHELGHSLAVITGVGFDQNNTPEGGWKLEDCVRNRGGFKYR